MDKNHLMLINSLMMLIQQYFHTFNKDGFVCVSHSNINAEENAIYTLVELGFAEELEEGMNGYRLRFDKLQTAMITMTY